MSKAIILDCDGVLAQTADAHLKAANAAFAAAGLDIIWDAAMYQRVSATAGFRAQTTAYFGRFGWPGGEADNVELLDAIEAEHARQFISLARAGEIELRNDAIALLKHASSQGMKIAVCSDDAPELGSGCVSRLGLGLASAIAVVAGGNSDQKPRPDPSIYAGIASQLGATPDVCTAIVAKPVGAMAAKAAGMEVCVLSDGSGTPSNIPGSRVISSLDPGPSGLGLAA